MQIYLDYSSTTPPRPEVVTYINQVCTQGWGNPSSTHQWGKKASMILERARIQIANSIKANDIESIIFTSGGTEANNLAILGTAKQHKRRQHIIISSVEHSSINKPIKFLETHGWEITRLPVDYQGKVNPFDLKAAIRKNTVLISIIYGQSEVGTLQPIKELSEIAKSYGILFHTDAAQAIGKLAINVQDLNIDLLSFSAHKIYGTQGIGALYIRPGSIVSPLFHGGGQEKGIRSGTQSLATIAGFGLATELICREMIEESNRLMQLRNQLFKYMSDYPYLIVSGDKKYRLPHHASFIFSNLSKNQKLKKITGQTIVRHMNLAGIGISAGSACHSGKLIPSPVLLAMGYSASDAVSGIRLTLGKNTSKDDITWTAIVLKQILSRLLS
ncbi:cysteine desulfurase family protein [Candidatus Atelocyanobacterium thalassae]|jgi:cysteine desulfurase|uniref:cysteine desulfurase n=1 Tax=Atelocyanobacterium thalassa (isolate ALOHA) TaxID=1453429 RepID=D3EP23_ATETH|nr:cysteine desulfurase family protein [Candidatus Atelocyanobacterium thalassa]ADB95223.1 cysteine desulfurase family protein [Candidatus Atelocyanobacterium thalassa isolate ALOHA]MCH2543856.1 cysteine desulfurase [Candidatus Atelocyanobacterium sp. ALOHA_A2.5_9]|tara:strand:+ start:101906 stop:103066 length:1161 start_codon:yes stop_codon:yes gene_type:complete